jgi:hypothetical protein
VTRRQLEHLLRAAGEIAADDEIVSAVSGDVDVDGRLARLERQGALQRAKAAPSRELFASRPKVKAGVSLLQALLAERSEAR